MVPTGTDAYRLTEEALQLARSVTEDRNVYTRTKRRRLDRGDGSGSREGSGVGPGP